MLYLSLSVIFPQLRMIGYNEKQLAFLTDVMNGLATFEVSSERFELIKESVSKCANKLDKEFEDNKIPTTENELELVFKPKVFENILLVPYRTSRC